MLSYTPIVNNLFNLKTWTSGVLKPKALTMTNLGHSTL